MEKVICQKCNKVEENYCTATHPMTPNLSGNARGRKLHLSEGKNKMTKCNMLVDEIRRDWSFTVFDDKSRLCKVCFKDKKIDSKHIMQTSVNQQLYGTR